MIIVVQLTQLDVLQRPREGLDGTEVVLLQQHHESNDPTPTFNVVHAILLRWHFILLVCGARSFLRVGVSPVEEVQTGHTRVLLCPSRSRSSLEKRTTHGPSVMVNSQLKAMTGPCVTHQIDLQHSATSVWSGRCCPAELLSVCHRRRGQKWEVNTTGGLHSQSDVTTEWLTCVPA